MRTGFKVLVLFAAFGCFGCVSPLPAAENPLPLVDMAEEPAFFEENPPEEVHLFSRPLRTIAPSEPERPSSRLPAPYRASNSLLLLPGALENSLTQHYIRYYSSPAGQASLAAIMGRAGPYLAFIRSKIAEMDLPPELIYLPVIESAYLATAVSRSGAAGLWQFMSNSIAPFDIRLTEWVDERRDFWKSTEGALRKLRGNYRYFNDWPLALAAYNAGLGGLNRLIQQSGVRDYWVLAERRILKDETIRYVPRLIAAAYVLSSQRLFGMEPLWPEDPQWQRLALDGRSVDLNMLAENAGVDNTRLVWANRELVYSITPPEAGYYLKVAGKDAEQIAAVLARDDIPLIRYHIHNIRFGDTLLAIALHYGLTVNQIQSANPGVQARNLRIGSRLLIPAFKDVNPYSRPVALREDIAFDGTHLVKQGETLWSLALAYDIDPEMLAEANGMRITDILREGRILKTPIR